MGWMTDRGVDYEYKRRPKREVLRSVGVLNNPVEVIKENYKNSYYSLIYRDLVTNRVDALHLLLIFDSETRRGDYIDLDIKELSIHNETFPKSYRKWLVDNGFDIADW